MNSVFHRILQWSAVVLLAVVLPVAPGWTQDLLPSWNDGLAKKTIVEFVGKVTKEGGPDFVSPGERVAVFDNDGTLWSEKPVYFQLLFAIDRVNARGRGDGHDFMQFLPRSVLMDYPLLIFRRIAPPH